MSRSRGGGERRVDRDSKAVDQFVDLRLGDDERRRQQRQVAIGAVGAILNIALDWIINDFTTPIEEVVEAACRLGTILEAMGRAS